MHCLIIFIFLVIITTLMILSSVASFNERKKIALEEAYYEKLYLDKFICKYCEKTLLIGSDKCTYCFAPVIMEAYESGYECGGKETVIEGDRKEILIDSLCGEFGITEGKMRRAIDSANKKIKRGGK